MSMILMRTDLANDMRVIRLSDLTGAKVGAIIGGLHAVWSAAQTLSTDGFIRYMTAARIDRLAEVDGFAAAMVDVGWLKVVPEGAEFPDFDAYFGRSSKSRAIDRLRKCRDRKGKGKGKNQDKPRTESGHNSDTTRTESGVVRAQTHDKGSIGSKGIERNGSHSPPATPGGESESVKVENKPTSTLPVPPVSPNSSPPTPPPPASQNPGGTSGPSGGAIDPGASWRYSQRNADGPPGFVKFWDEYPKGRRTNKAGCIARWEEYRLDLIADQILASLRRWKASWEAKRRAAKPGTDADYTVAPLRFLVETFWEATPEMPAGAGGADPGLAEAVEASAKKFQALGAAEQEAICERIYEAYPNLRGVAKDHGAFTGAIHKALMGTLKQRKVAV